MTQQHGATRRTCGQNVHKWRVWGATPTSDFFGPGARKNFQCGHTLTGGDPVKVNPKLTALNVELAQAEAEIEKLINGLMGANNILLSYANGKIEELDTRRQMIMKEIADMSAEAVSPEQIARISELLDNWDNISFEDRRDVADGMISQIKATNEDFDIVWKI